MRGGVLVVDKPSGPTSFEVVKRVRRLLRAAKAGHTGTLDPMATGVLAVCVDDAVKLQQWLTDGDKAYQATVAFGAATDTEDAEGEVVARADPAGLDAAAIRAALPRFTGEIEQVPPMYSAVRVGGRRLHEAARAGEEVDRAARRVTVHDLELLEVAGVEGGLRRARLAVRCGKGTYVRTLAADLGRALGVPAHLVELRRTRAGPFDLGRALELREAESIASGAGGPAALARRLVPPEEAMAFLPRVEVRPDEARALLQGRALSRPGTPDGEACAVLPGLGLVAICEASGGSVRPARVLIAAAELAGSGG
ncbi:MAG TPA: tRNA pseudouridine(55) synthase TruB [Anaeromyxobacteraceae bacterium]|nr:tRNA pseudouridine(55) synthase TruB [Anaeromyxobacteraceae bacterium]